MGPQAVPGVKGWKTLFEEHLSFSNQIISSAHLGPNTHSELKKMADRIQARLTDNHLYLAVIGEFSSGKSTFINALLRDHLLKSASLVTTAMPTRIVYDSELAVDLTFRAPGQAHFHVSGEKNATSWWHTFLSWFRIYKDRISVSWLPEAKGLTTREFIQAVTTRDDAGKLLQSVQISYPSNFLKDNIVLIDTPGLNATNPAHIEKTRQIIEHTADLAIIITSANQPIPQSLMDYLDGPLKPYIHRCIFVATKMDGIPESEQEGIIEYIKGRITKNLGIQNPLVLPAAPQIVLDHHARKKVSKENQEWIQQFSSLERVIQECLHTQFEVYIVENIQRLLLLLIENLQNHLEEKQREYYQEEERIRQEVIQDLVTFTKEQQKLCESKLEVVTRQMREVVSGKLSAFRSETLSQLESEINRATSKSELNKRVKENIPKILESQAAQLPSLLQPVYNQYTAQVNEVGAFFDQKFAAEYKRLAALGGTLVTVNQVVNTALATSEAKTLLVGASSHTQSAQNGEAASMVGTAAAATALALLVFPPAALIAWLPGLLGGKWLADLFAPLSDKKREAWNKIKSEVNPYFGQIESKVMSSFDHYTSTALNGLYNRVDAYIQKYAQLVKEIKEQQARKLANLKALEQETDSYLKGLRERRLIIEKYQISSDKYSVDTHPVLAAQVAASR